MTIGNTGVEFLARPLPVPTAESRAFWTGAADNELTLPYCEACALYSYPPPPRCSYCLNASLAWRKVSPFARLVSWTTVRIDVLPGVPPPFVVVEVELEQQAGLMMAVLMTGSAVGLRAGMPVEILFTPTRDPKIGLPRVQAAPLPMASL